MQATLSLSTFSSELFPAPVLRTSFSSPHQEGNLVNLSCETKLPSEKPGLQLYFSFYVGNKTLMSRTTSSEYQTFIAKTEDPGLYWCEAATEDGNLIKRSPELELPVLGERERGELTDTQGDIPFPPLGLRSQDTCFTAHPGKNHEQVLHSWFKTSLFSS